MSQPFSRALGALLVLALYVALIALANYFAFRAEGGGGLPWMLAATLTTDLIAAIAISLILPLWLAARWGLALSWWPEAQHWPLALALLAGFVLLSSFDGVGFLIASGLPMGRLAVHFSATALLQFACAPLFLVLMLGTWRSFVGVFPAMLLTSAGYTAAQAAQWHLMFPGGPSALVLLFTSFLVLQFLYLITRSLWLVALAHCLNSAVMLVEAGRIHTTMDITFWIGAVTLGLLLLWSIADMRRPDRHGARIWIKLIPDD